MNYGVEVTESSTNKQHLHLHLLLLDYSHLVSDLQQSKRPADPTVGRVSKRPKVCDFATDTTGGVAIDD